MNPCGGGPAKAPAGHNIQPFKIFSDCSSRPEKMPVSCRGRGGLVFFLRVELRAPAAEGAVQFRYFVATDFGRPDCARPVALRGARRCRRSRDRKARAGVPARPGSPVRTIEPPHRADLVRPPARFRFRFCRRPGSQDGRELKSLCELPHVADGFREDRARRPPRPCRPPFGLFPQPRHGVNIDCIS